MGGLLDFGTVVTHDDPSQVDGRKLGQLGQVLENVNSGKVVASWHIAGPQILFGFWASSVAAQFILLFDAADVPADTAVPLLSFPVAATSGVGAQWIPGRYFANGIVICNSSTQHTKTIGSADCIFDLQVL